MEAMSLYNHVRSKEDLLDGMVDLFSEIDLTSGDDRDWKSAMRQHALSAREVLARHRWAIGLVDSRSSPGPATMRRFDDSLRCLRNSSGSRWPPLPGHLQLRVRVRRPDARHDARSDQAQQILELTGSDRYPSAREITEYMLRAGDDNTHQFESGLDLISMAASLLLETRSSTPTEGSGATYSVPHAEDAQSVSGSSNCLQHRRKVPAGF